MLADGGRNCRQLCGHRHDGQKWDQPCPSGQSGRRQYVCNNGSAEVADGGRECRLRCAGNRHHGQKWYKQCPKHKPLSSITGKFPGTVTYQCDGQFSHDHDRSDATLIGMIRNNTNDVCRAYRNCSFARHHDSIWTTSCPGQDITRHWKCEDGKETQTGGPRGRNCTKIQVEQRFVIKPKTIEDYLLDEYIISTLLVILVTFWCVWRLPDYPRLTFVPRHAFIVGIANFTGHFLEDPIDLLPGATADASRMDEALGAAYFQCVAYYDVEKAKSIGNPSTKFFIENPGNLMSLFDNWAGSLQHACDVFIYIASHGIKFEGKSLWIVPATAEIKLPISVGMQCVEVNWLRIRMAAAMPRVTIFVLDCCNTHVSFDYSPDPSDRARRMSEVSKHMVDITKLNSSHAALNVVIFYGAADGTVAMESGGGGDFTTAFITHMKQKDRPLELISQLIRSDLTQGCETIASETIGAGSRVVVTNTFVSINEEERIIRPGVYGEVLILDESDNTIEVRFDGFDDTQWVDSADIGRLKIDEAVQVSPSENYLSHETRGWCFYESARLVPASVENCLVRLLREGKCCACEAVGGADITGASDRSSTGTHRGMGGKSSKNISLAIEGAGDPTTSDRSVLPRHSTGVSLRPTSDHGLPDILDAPTSSFERGDAIRINRPGHKCHGETGEILHYSVDKGKWKVRFSDGKKRCVEESLIEKVPLDVPPSESSDSSSPEILRLADDPITSIHFECTQQMYEEATKREVMDTDRRRTTIVSSAKLILLSPDEPSDEPTEKRKATKHGAKRCKAVGMMARIGY